MALEEGNDSVLHIPSVDSRLYWYQGAIIDMGNIDYVPGFLSMGHKIGMGYRTHPEIIADTQLCGNVIERGFSTTDRKISGSRNGRMV